MALVQHLRLLQTEHLLRFLAASPLARLTLGPLHWLQQPFPAETLRGRMPLDRGVDCTEVIESRLVDEWLRARTERAFLLVEAVEPHTEADKALTQQIDALHLDGMKVFAVVVAVDLEERLDDRRGRAKVTDLKCLVEALHKLAHVIKGQQAFVAGHDSGDLLREALGHPAEFPHEMQCRHWVQLASGLGNPQGRGRPAEGPQVGRNSSLGTNEFLLTKFNQGAFNIHSYIRVKQAAHFHLPVT